MLASNRPKADRDRLVACVTVLCEAVGRTPTMATYLAYEIGTEGITIEAMLKDLGREPDRDDTFVLAGTTYTVLAVIENDGRFVRVSVRQEA